MDEWPVGAKTSKSSPPLQDRPAAPIPAERARAGDALKAVRARNSSSGFDSPTLRRILAGAVTAVGRHGTRKLSMEDICAVSGVSRGTLYRYFATKEDVLTAVSESISLAFEKGVVAAVASHADPIDQLKAALECQFFLAEQEAKSHLIEVEPAFVMKFLSDHLDRHIAAMKRALAPAFELLEQRAGGSIDRDLLAEALVRIGLSTALVPGNAAWRKFPGLLSELVGTIARQARSAARNKTSSSKDILAAGRGRKRGGKPLAAGRAATETAKALSD